MRRSVKSLMALVMVVLVSAPMAVLSGCGAASGSETQDNAGAANAQVDTVVVDQTGSGAEAGTDTNTGASTDTSTGSETGGDSSSGEKIVIKCWHRNTEIQGGLVVDELVKQFNESNNHIQVVAKYNPDMYKGLMQNPQAEATAGSLPTLIQTNWAFLDYLSNNFSYASPQEVIDGFDKEDAGFLQDKFPPNVLELAVNNQGPQVDIPYSLSNPTFYINKDALREAGLAEDGPATWQEVSESAKTIKEEIGKYGFYTREPADLWAQRGLIESSGAKMLTTSAEGKKEASFATENGVEVVQLIVDMVKDQTTLHTSQGKGCQNFTDGNCAMLCTTITRRASVQKGAQFDVTTVRSLLWRDKERMVPTGGCSLAITARGDDRIEAAWEFEEFLYSVESIAAWTKGTGYMPPRKDVAGVENGPKVFLAENKMVNAVIQQMNGVIPWATFPGDAGLQAEQVFLDMRDQILGGQVMAEQGMEAAQDVISQLLAIQ